MWGEVIDETRRTYGRLTVVERAENTPAGKAKWRCRCACGRECIVIGSHLRNGNTASCGCWKKEKARAPKRLNQLWAGYAQTFPDRRQRVISDCVEDFQK